MKLTGRTVLITGGGSGIGAALAHRFHAAGARSVLVGRDPTKLARMAALYPGTVTYVIDLSHPDGVSTLIRRCQQDHPELSVLVNNAGIQEAITIGARANDEARIQQEIDTNFTSVVRLCHGLLPLLLGQPSATIINVTSALAVVPKPSAPIYCATKAAVRSFTYTLREQLRTTPVRVFELMPPLVDTAMTEGRGSGKRSPRAVADAFFRDLAADRWESRIGKARPLVALHRLWPALAHRILARS